MRYAYEALKEREIDHFTLDEWPDQEMLKHVDARVLFALDELRERYGRAIYPSKHPKGWARFSGSQGSKHYAVDRLCTAGDVFPSGNVLDCWMAAIRMRQWGGFGLYLDTKRTKFQPGPMMHLDLRPGPRVFWVRNEVGDYTYKHEDPKKFWSAIARVAEVDNA